MESFIRLHVVQAKRTEGGNFAMEVGPQHGDAEMEIPGDGPGRACQIMPAASSTRVWNPRYQTALCDAASNIWQTLRSGGTSGGGCANVK